MKSLMQFFLIAAFSFYIGGAKAQQQKKQEPSSQFKKVIQNYSQGKYKRTVEELEAIEEQLKKSSKADKKTLGLIAYWKGMAYNRLQNFAKAIGSFSKAEALNYDTIDLNYEYGQALFAGDKLIPARIQFDKSFKKGFKKGTSLYYMAFISKDLGEREKAKSLFNAVKNLSDGEGKEARQASEMQLADMELEDAEKKTNVFKAVETEVIPIYESAMAMNPKSPLAPRIKEKITSLQKKYELVLFQLRNGRPTAIPAHFLRLAQEIGNDSNVTFTPTETTVAKSKQSSIFSKTEAVGRYTFYHKNYISVAPELRFNYSRYYNRVSEIFRNDNYNISPALRTTYEHVFREKPASVLFDYEYNESHRDVEAKKSLDFSSRSHAVMLGERFTYWSFGESTVRMKYRKFTSYLEASNSKTTSFIYEQTASLKDSVLIFYSSYDMTRVNDESFNTNVFNLRTDWLLPKYKDWFTPSLGLGITMTDPINDRMNRGTEWMLNPNTRLSRKFGNNWGGSFRLEHQKNSSRDEASFAFKKTVYAFEAEYIF